MTSQTKKLKHYVRDALVWLIARSGLAALYRARVRREGPLVRVLCFHDVPDREWFESVIAMLTKEYRVITPQQFLERDFALDNINILLTFDDGYQSWVDVALTVLAQYDCKGVFFITSGLLDAAEAGEKALAPFVRERLRLQRTYQPLSWDGARTLVAAGHTIGGHTRTHASLGQLSSEAAIEQEVTEDKTCLETQLGISPQWFAYPFGRPADISELSETVVARHYPQRFAAETGFLSKVEPYPRTLIIQSATPHQLQYWVDGAYDIVSKLLHKL